MAQANLIPCPDCEAEISAKARACPRCGRPIPANADGIGLEPGCMLALAVACAAIGLLSQFGSTAASAIQQQAATLWGIEGLIAATAFILIGILVRSRY